MTSRILARAWSGLAAAILVGPGCSSDASGPQSGAGGESSAGRATGGAAGAIKGGSAGVGVGGVTTRGGGSGKGGEDGSGEGGDGGIGKGGKGGRASEGRAGGGGELVGGEGGGGGESGDPNGSSGEGGSGHDGSGGMSGSGAGTAGDAGSAGSAGAGGVAGGGGAAGTSGAGAAGSGGRVDACMPIGCTDNSITVYGDVQATRTITGGVGERTWYWIDVRESKPDDTSARSNIGAMITLTSPPGVDYALAWSCDSACFAGPPANQAQGLTGHSESIYYFDVDVGGSRPNGDGWEQSSTIHLGVVAVEPSVDQCIPWTLTITTGPSPLFPTPPNPLQYVTFCPWY